MQELEELFNRALRFSFSRKKLYFTFPVLLGCGVLVVLSRVLAFAANQWVTMSLAFMPVFFSTGALLAAGVLLTRIYYHEVKDLPFRFRKLFNQSVQLVIGVSYLCLPLIALYLLLWTLMGIFHLLKVIPAIGPAIGVLLAFGPFLLVVACLALSLISLLILFFVTPHVALKNNVRLNIAKEIIERVNTSVFINILHFIVAIAPLFFSVGMLCLAAMVTNVQYLQSTSAISISFEWLFIMVPFTLMLTPFVIFFFNFATESYGYLQRRKKKEKEPIEEACVTQ